MQTTNRLLLCLLIVSVFSIKTDLVLNGNFSYNLCPENYCSWNTSTYDSVDIYGWIPDPEIHIATGHLFNPILDYTKVLYLPGTTNSCVKQVFDTLKIGSYTLNIHYIAQNATNETNPQFKVYFNQILLKTLSPSRKELYQESIRTQLVSFSRNVELKFCAEANSERVGTILTKVEFWGEGKSSLRKEDPILSTYHLLPLKQKSSRILTTVPLMDYTPTLSSSNTNSLSTATFPAVSPSNIFNWNPTNMITPTYSTFTVNAPSPSNTWTAPISSTLNFNSATPQVNSLQYSASTLPTVNNFGPTMTSASNDIISSMNNAFNSMNLSMPKISVSPTVVNVSAMTNLTGGGSISLPTLTPTTQNFPTSPLNSNPITALNSASTLNLNLPQSVDSKVILNGTWSEMKSPIGSSQNLTTSKNWSSNSNCTNNTDSSTVNSAWTEKKPTTNLSVSSVLNPNWKSNSNCSKPQGSTNSQWVEKKSLNDLSSKSINSSKWTSNSNCTVNSVWKEKQSSLDQKSTIRSGWDSNSNCTKVDGSSWTQKKSTRNLSSSSVKIGWKSNTECKEKPEKALTTENKPDNTLQGFSVNGLGENLQTLTASEFCTPTDLSEPILPYMDGTFMNQEAMQRMSQNSAEKAPVTDVTTPSEASVNKPTPTPQLQPTETATSNKTLAETTSSQVPNPLTVPTQVSAPVPTQVSAPVPTQVSAPVSTQVSAPVSTQVSAPVSTQVSAPVPTQVSAPVPTQVSASASTQVSASASTQVSAPAPTQVSASAPTQVSAPASTQVSAPAPTQVSAPVVQNKTIQQINTQIKPEPQKSSNFIMNGGFETYKCEQPPCLINQLMPNTALDSWVAEPSIEMGLVQKYNPSLHTAKDNMAVHLGFSSKNTCIKQSLKGLKNQFYDLTFEYAPVLPHSDESISEAFFIVKFNGRNVKNVLVLQKTLQKQYIVVKGIRGENIIEFCAFGSGNENPHGAIIDNVVLMVKPDPENMKTDFIVNGDFQNNFCYSQNCLWNKQNFVQKNLVGWLPEPEIEIGKGTVYNVHAGISTVAELSPNSNSCIKQVIDNCVSGSFKLEFSWAAREAQMLHDSIFQIKINDNLIKNFIPNDYMMHRENVILNLKEGKNELKFCSFGMNNNKGAIIDDVSMFLIESCGGV